MKAYFRENIARSIQAGSILRLGRYMLPTSGKPYDLDIKIYKDLEWIVLHREGMRVLLLSRDIVDWDFIDGTGNPQTWENCFARKEILPKFYEECFTDKEKRLIVPVKLFTDDNPVFGTKGGRSTIDYVFLLSAEEFRKYVSPEAAAAPMYMLERCFLKGLEEEKNFELFQHNTEWWLRTPGAEQYCNAIVNRYGELDLEGLENGSDEVGIRPAIWINLIEILQEDGDDDLPF